MAYKQTTLAKALKGAKAVTKKAALAVAKKIPGFQDLWRFQSLSDEEALAEAAHLRKERFRQDLKAAGYGAEYKWRDRR